MSQIKLWLIVICNIIISFSSHPKFSTEMKDRSASYLVQPFPFKTQWPLCQGLAGISINNLNKYIKPFSGCLVHVYNYQGIEITGITEPIVLSRFDVFGTKDYQYKKPRKLLHRLLIEKVPQITDLQNYTKSYGDIYVHEKSTKARWYCQAKFDLFHPEIKDAAHFHVFGFERNRQPLESLNFGPHVFNADKFEHCKKY